MDRGAWELAKAARFLDEHPLQGSPPTTGETPSSQVYRMTQPAPEASARRPDDAMGTRAEKSWWRGRDCHGPNNTGSSSYSTKPTIDAIKYPPTAYKHQY